MNFPHGVNLDRVSLKPDKDEIRTHLCQPYLDLSDPEYPCVVATNGHCLAAVRIEPEDDGSDVAGPVTRGAMKAANGVAEQTGGKAVLIATDVIRSERAGLTFDRPPETSPYPDWRACLPTRKPTVRVSVNAKLLRDISRALDSELLMLELVPDHNGDVLDGIRVTPFTNLDCKAVLMPCHYSDGERAEKADSSPVEDAPLPFDGATAPAGTTCSITHDGVTMPANTPEEMAAAAKAMVGKLARRKGPKAGE